MGFLPEELKTQTFPCPACGHYVNDEVDVCKFCGSEITSGMKADAIKKEQAERTRIFLGTEKQLIFTGLAILVAGIGNIIVPTFDFYLDYSSRLGLRVPCLSPLAIILGFTMALIGVRGYLRGTKR